MNNQIVSNNNLPDAEKIHKALPTEKETIAVLMALLEGLSYNVLSSDAWWLSMHSASHVAVDKYHISPDVVKEVIERFECARKNKSKKNPMNSMF